MNSDGLPIDAHTGRGYLRGRVALAALLRTLRIGAGDRVVVPGYSCSALAEGVIATGARPVYVDVDPETYNISPSSLNAALDDRVRAVVIQHTYGIPADMESLLALTEEHGLPVIEDCCHTLDSRWRGRLLGTFGYGAFYSFEAGKPITTGIGGWARVNDQAPQGDLARDHDACAVPSMVQQAKIELMRRGATLLYRPGTYWRVKKLYNRLQALGIIAKTYNTMEQDEAGSVLADAAQQEFKTRLGSVQARAVIGALGRYRRTLARRRTNIAAAWRALETAGVRGLPRIPADADAILIRLPALVDDKERTLALAAERNVELSNNYVSPVHPYKGEALRAFGYEPGSCPASERIADEVVCLPVGPATRDRDIERGAALVAAQ